MSKNVERDSNIELLRILTIIGVIILHFNLHDGIKLGHETSQMNYYLLIMLECISISAVNIFMIISGYFSCDKSSIQLNKPILLIVEVVIWNAIFELISSQILNEKFSMSVFIPHNYFVTFYIVIYLLSPLINKIIHYSDVNKVAVTIFVIFSVFATLEDLFEYIIQQYGFNLTGLNPITRKGSLDGYTIVNFAMCYLIGATIKENKNKIDKIKFSKLLVFFLMNLLIILGSTLFFNKQSNIFYPSISLSYSNPFVIIEAILVFIIFTKLKIGKSKIINSISKSCFCVYILQGFFVKRIAVKSAFLHGPVVLIAYILSVAIGIFILGSLFYYLYSLIERMIVKKINVSTMINYDNKS